MSSDIQANITVKRLFSWPVVCMETEDVPFFSMMKTDGRLKVSGVWSALPMRDSGGFSSLRRWMIKLSLCARSRHVVSTRCKSCVVWIDHVVP